LLGHRGHHPVNHLRFVLGHIHRREDQ
jgi:hypothetical protein